jgi:hypothetical protein
MAEPVRFQCSLADDDIAKQLRAIPAGYRSLFVELALDAWFANEQVNGRNRFASVVFPSSQKKPSRPTRFRLSLANKNIVRRLRAIASRHRSLVVQMAIINWLESKTGRKMHALFSGKDMRQTPAGIQATTGCFNPADNSHEVSDAANAQASDTEKLMKTALEFS